MTKEEFQNLFEQATTQAIEFAKQYVINEIHSKVKYKLYPNQSYDDEGVVEDEELFPKESLPKEEYHLFDTDEAVSFLWRNGKVPEWIDVAVQSVKDDTTFIELLCCGRFTARQDFLYYTHVNMGPFGVKSPCLPSLDWESVEKSGKFNLHWPEQIKEE